MRKRKCRKGYWRRNLKLKRMGFDNYADYLESDLWKGIRARVLQIHNNKCMICKEYAFTVHHLSYDKQTLAGRRFDKLVPLCESCHEKVEFTDGVKNTFEQVEAKYKELRSKR